MPQVYTILSGDLPSQVTLGWVKLTINNHHSLQIEVRSRTCKYWFPFYNNWLLDSLTDWLVLCVCVSIYMCTWTCTHGRSGQRSTFKSQFTPSTMWVPGLNSGQLSNKDLDSLSYIAGQGFCPGILPHPSTLLASRQMPTPTGALN